MLLYALLYQGFEQIQAAVHASLVLKAGVRDTRSESALQMRNMTSIEESSQHARAWGWEGSPHCLSKTSTRPKSVS
jgi:hypothetical protein